MSGDNNLFIRFLSSIWIGHSDLQYQLHHGSLLVWKQEEGPGSLTFKSCIQLWRFYSFGASAAYDRITKHTRSLIHKDNWIKTNKPRQRTLLRFPNPNLLIVDSFQSGNGGTKSIRLMPDGRIASFRTPSGSVIKTASAVNVVWLAFVREWLVVISTPLKSSITSNYYIESSRVYVSILNSNLIFTSQAPNDGKVEKILKHRSVYYLKPRLKLNVI